MSSSQPSDQVDDHQSLENARTTRKSVIQQALIVYQGVITHLTGEDSHQSYTEDPLNSCLASRLLSGR